MVLRWFAVLGAPLSFLACSFVLDFDELEAQNNDDRIGFGGAQGDGGAGGSESMGGTSTGGVGGSAAGQAGADPGIGGSTGGGGTGGSGFFEECGGDCDDGDPCTRDFCDTTSTPAVCAHAPREGVLHDGFRVSLTAEVFHRATMTAGGDEFFLSAFRSIGDETETTLYAIPREQEEVIERFRTTDLGEGVAASAMGMVVDENNLLHAYVALVDSIGGGNARVNHLRFDDPEEPTSTVAGFGFDASLPWRHPKAFSVNGGVHGAWIDLAGSIAMHLPNGTLVTFNANSGVPARATSFTPVAGATDPGVMFTRSRGGVFAELRGGDDVELAECAGGGGSYLTMHSALVTDPEVGAWLTGWTTTDSSSFTTETKLVVCSDDVGCESDPCDAGAPVMPNVRNPAEAVMPLDDGTLLLARATPELTDDGQATLGLEAFRVDYADLDAVVVSDFGRSAEVSSQAADSSLQGPDLPALAFLPPDKLALTWIEPDPGLGVTALRLRRYHVCVGPE